MVSHSISPPPKTQEIRYITCLISSSQPLEHKHTQLRKIDFSGSALNCFYIRTNMAFFFFTNRDILLMSVCVLYRFSPLRISVSQSIDDISLTKTASLNKLLHYATMFFFFLCNNDDDDSRVWYGMERKCKVCN